MTVQQIVEHRNADIDDAVCIGALSDDAVDALCEAVAEARTLSQDHKDFIIERLRSAAPF
jgi:hypothetical protein